MDRSVVDRWEMIGLGAGLVMILSLFLKWFSLGNGADVERGTDAANWVCGVGETSCSGWESFPILRWLLIAGALAPAILVYILVRGHKLSWPRGEMTAVVGLMALVLIGYNGLVDRPSETDIQVNLSYGYFLALIASIGIFISGGFRAVDSGGGAQRKPPATF